MSKEILINAFNMNCVTHQSSGMWRHPADRSREYYSLNHRFDLAKTMERGLMVWVRRNTTSSRLSFRGCEAESALHGCPYLVAKVEVIGFAGRFSNRPVHGDSVRADQNSPLVGFYTIQDDGRRLLRSQTN